MAPTTSLVYRVVAYDDDGGEEGGDRRWRFKARLTTLARIITVLLVLADVVSWLNTRGMISTASGFLVAIIVALGLAVVWNLLHIFPQASQHSVWLRVLPSSVCKLGDSCGCVLDGREGRFGKRPEDRRLVRRKLVWGALIDFVLGLTIVVSAANSWSFFWPYRSDVVGVLLIVTGSFELGIALATLIFRYFYRYIVVGIVVRGTDDDGTYTRIRHAPDDEDRTAGAAVSPV